MVDMLCKIDPSFKNYITYGKEFYWYDKQGYKHTGRQKMLVGKLKKAVYGTLFSAKIFYDNLRATLEEIGFVVNDYDECTFNKMTPGGQCTIQFHVDDLKLSCKDESELKSVISKLNNVFGQEGPKLSENTGKIHDYLGMTIDWTGKRRVLFTMYDFLEDIMVDAPPEFDGEDFTPATKTLFTVDENSPLLPLEKAEYFH